MAKITRVTSIIFASGASGTDIEQFGSKVQTGTPNYSTDPAVIQALAAWSTGWSSALVVANKSEYKQDRNAVDYVASYQIGYLLQQGISEYDSATPYYTNSVVQYGGLFYISLIDNNSGNQPDINPSDWRNMSASPTTTVKTSGSGTYTPPAGCVFISVRMVGGGGGGGAGGSTGGNTTFGGFTAGGGGGSGGAAGASTGGSVNIAGGCGTSDGQGGSSYFGGAGYLTNPPAANSGSGAGGTSGTPIAGSSGGYLEGSISAPGSISYAVGAGGTGTHAGAAGIIIITEFYY